MLKLKIITQFVLFSFLASANPPPKVVKAHNHEESTWSLAFEGKVGKLLIESASESIIGLEREPKNKKEAKKVNDALKKFEEKISLMVQFPKNLSCAWSKKTLDVLRDENDKKHSEVAGEFEVSCQVEPSGAEIVFNIQKYFPKFKTANVEVLYGNIQKSFVADRAGVKVLLK